jgi:hypothetical protein
MPATDSIRFSAGLAPAVDPVQTRGHLDLVHGAGHRRGNAIFAEQNVIWNKWDHRPFDWAPGDNVEGLAKPNTDIYITLCRFHGEHRVKKNAVWVAGCWLDLDVKPDDPTKPQTEEERDRVLAALPEPTLLVASSPECRHVYWLYPDGLDDVERGLRLAQGWIGWCNQLASEVLGRPITFDGVADLARVFRLAGTIRWTPASAAPFRVELLKADGPRYPVEEIERCAEYGRRSYKGRSSSSGGEWEEVDRDALDDKTRAALKALEALGGHNAYQVGKAVYVTRPGKDNGASASINYVGPAMVYVFTSNWPPLEQGGVYSIDQLDGSLQQEDDAEIQKHLRWLRVRDRARELRAEELSADVVRPTGTKLKDLLAEPESQQRWRVEELWPVDSRIVLAAARKTGKTTLMGGVVRSLADGLPLLGQYKVSTGKVGLVDFEMSRDMLRRWLRDQGVQSKDQATVWPMRGLVGSFDILTDHGRTAWARQFRDAGLKVLLLDCLAPVLAALDLEETNYGVGRFLDAFDALLAEAGITDALIAHHMGHGPERSRGGSRLRDWPEAEWRLVRERTEDDEEVEAGARFFSAYGRDVEVGESRLTFDPVSRHLKMAGESRSTYRYNQEVIRVVAAVAALEAEGKSASKNVINTRVRGQKSKVDDRCDEAVSLGYLTRDKVGQAHVHHVTDLGRGLLASTGSEPVPNREPVTGSPTC